MNSLMSRKFLNNSIPRPWFNEAGLTSHMFYSQCLTGTRSLFEPPREISLYLVINKLISSSSLTFEMMNVVGVVSKTV